MKGFRRIVAVDALNGNVTDDAKALLRELSGAPITFPADYPGGAADIVGRIGVADAALLSWQTPLTRETIERLPGLRYVGVTATNTARIDMDAIADHAITLTNVTGYSEEPTAEWIFGELLAFARGSAGHSWRDQPVELFGKRLGIVGLGAVGQAVAYRAAAFGMATSYTSRTRRERLEGPALHYVRAIEDLLARSEIISLHTPPGLEAIDRDIARRLPADAIIVNTSIGQPIAEEALAAWLSAGRGWLILDETGGASYSDALRGAPRVITSSDSGGHTAEARERLSATVVDNARRFLERKRG